MRAESWYSCADVPNASTSSPVRWCLTERRETSARRRPFLSTEVPRSVITWFVISSHVSPRSVVISTVPASPTAQPTSSCLISPRNPFVFCSLKLSPCRWFRVGLGTFVHVAPPSEVRRMRPKRPTTSPIPFTLMHPGGSTSSSARKSGEERHGESP